MFSVTVNVFKFHTPILYANTVAPDQTAPAGAVWSGATLFAVTQTTALKFASLGGSDAHPTGDQVTGSTPAEVGNILLWRFDHEIFYGHSLPSADSRRAVVSFWQKNVHNTG